MKRIYFEVQSCWPESAMSAEREWRKHPRLLMTLQEAEEYQRYRQQLSSFAMAVFRIVEVEE